MLIFGEDNNISENFIYDEDKEFIQEKQDFEKDYRNLINKSLDTRNQVKNSLLEHIV